MIGYIVVFVGAGIGGTIRHFVNIWVARLMGTHFPYHTFVINITGSLVMGLVAGYTTFSAFSLDAVLIWERHEPMLAALYVGGSVVLSLIGLVVGLWVMRTALA